MLTQGASVLPGAGTPGITVGVHNNSIYYQGLTIAGNFSSSSLFHYNPSSNIATPVSNIPNTAADGFLLAKSINGVLYLNHQTNSAGLELHGFAGSSVIQITDIDGPSAGFIPTEILSYNGNLLIAGTTAANGTELYRITGNGLGLTDAQQTSAAILSPNPASAQLTVTLPSSARYTLRILSATGQTLRTHALQGASASVSVQDLPAGLYFARITDAASGAPAGTARFVKE